MVLRMVPGSLIVKRNDAKLRLLSLLWVIPSILAMSNSSSVVVNGIMFTVWGKNETREEAKKICKRKNAFLPLYMSTEIQSEVVQKLGNHWIALRQRSGTWEWHAPNLTADVSNRWKCNGNYIHAITDGPRQLMQVNSSFLHPVVCEGEGGLMEGLNNSSDLNVNGTVFRSRGDRAPFSNAETICISNNARLPQYISTEIQRKVVEKFGDHWVGLKKQGNGWIWLRTVLSANETKKWIGTENKKGVVTSGQRHWKKVPRSSRHQVVCEGRSTDVVEITTETPTPACTSTASPDATTTTTASVTTTTTTETITFATDATTTTAADTTTTTAADTTTTTAADTTATTATDATTTTAADTNTTTAADTTATTAADTTATTALDTKTTTAADTTTATATDPTTTTAADTTTTTATDATATTATDPTTTTAADTTTTTAADTTTTTAADTTTTTATDATTTTATDPTTTTAADTNTTTTADVTTTTAADTTTTTAADTTTTTAADTTTTTAADTTTTTAADTNTTTATDPTTTTVPLGVDNMGRKISKKCVCRCRNPEAAPTKPEVVDRKVAEMKSYASVNLKTVTKSIVKKTSRVDKRPSPAVIGWAYLIVVAIPLMAVVFSDIVMVVKWICVKKNNMFLD